MHTIFKSTSFLFLATASLAHAYEDYNDDTCDAEECLCTYCFGPSETAIDVPVNPRTCKGDFVVEASGFYWRAEQDGMEYAVRNHLTSSETSSGNPELNNLIDAEYLSPSFSWEFGLRLGVGYNNACDGWDFRAIWTRYRQSSSTHDKADTEDNQSLLPLWSSFQYPLAGTAPVLFATAIDTTWKLHLGLLDLEMGRAAWNSHRLSIRPYMGLRLGKIDEFFDIEYKGGSWNSEAAGTNFNDFVELTSFFKGIGIRGGIDTHWNLNCGFALFGEAATSILYGRFQVDHLEYFREAVSPFAKTRYFDTEDRFRASRGVVDLLLGVEWSALFCECRYGFTISLAFEEHLFFHQNPFWRVERVGGEDDTTMLPYNDTGENIFYERRGSLSTEGWTLTVQFEF